MWVFEMTKFRVAFGVWLLAWGLVLFVGIRLYLGVVAQKVLGYPKPAQLDMYVLFPSALVMANIALIAYARKLPIPLLLVAFVIQMLTLPVFIVLGGGGV
jgi:hypothetical protein